MKAAEELAQAVLSLPAVFPWYANMARSALGLVAVQRGDIATAQEQYAALEALPSILVHYITSDRLLGLLAQTVGQLDRSVNHFEDALALCKQAGYRPELAWTCHDCADTLLERNGPSDPDRAASLMEAEHQQTPGFPGRSKGARTVAPTILGMDDIRCIFLET